MPTIRDLVSSTQQPSDSTIGPQYINKTLHVPAGTRDTYKQSAIWTKFVKIIEEGNGSANIENITSTFEDNTTSHNLQGMKVDNNYKGIVIINGKKILKK